MRVFTKFKPYTALDNARRKANGEDFDELITIESKIDSSGLLIFGPTKEDNLEYKPTKLDIAWGDKDGFLRMKYIIEGGAKGLLLSAFDETHLPEIRFVVDKGLDGFEFTADHNGSTYLFGKFAEEKGQLDISEEAWMPGLKTLHATMMTDLYINKLIGDALETMPQDS